MRRITTLSLIWIISFSISVFSLSITTQPPSFDLTVNPAGVRTFLLEVENADAQKRVKLNIYTETIKIGPEGDLTFLSLEDNPKGSGSWIKAYNSSIILGPLDKKRVPLRLMAPAKTSSGGYYAAIIVEPDNREKPAQKGLRVAFRLASIVRITVRGSQPLLRKASIDDFFYLTGPIDPKSLNEVEVKGPLGMISKEFPNTDGVFFVALLKNEGNIHFKTTGKVLIRTKAKRRKGEVGFVGGTGIVYPGSGRFFIAHFPYFLSENDYIAQLRFRQKGLSTLTKDFPFSIKVTNNESSNEMSVLSPLAITPEILEISASRGAFRTNKCSVFNRLKEDITLAVSLEGEVGKWIEIKSSRINILSGRSKDVVFRINIPRHLGDDSFSGIIRFRDQENSIDQELKIDVLIEGANREW